MLIYVGAHCKKCNLLARNIDPLTSQGHARWTVAQTDWNFHPPLKLANSLLPQQPVNPHFICVATFNTCYFKVLDCPPLSAKVLGERIWAWISVKRTSHSVKGPLIAWKDREFGGQHFDMSETSRSHTFSWDESTLKSWKMWSKAWQLNFVPNKTEQRKLADERCFSMWLLQTNLSAQKIVNMIGSSSKELGVRTYCSCSHVCMRCSVWGVCASAGNV